MELPDSYKDLLKNINKTQEDLNRKARGKDLRQSTKQGRVWHHLSVTKAEAFYLIVDRQHTLKKKIDKKRKAQRQARKRQR